MLAFLRKTIERSDEAITPEERLLERKLVESILRKEQEERDKDISLKKKSKKGKKKGAKPVPGVLIAPANKSGSNITRLESTESAGSESGDLERPYILAAMPSADDDGIPTVPNTPKTSSTLVSKQVVNSKGQPEILQAMQEKAVQAAILKTTQSDISSAPGAGELISLDEVSVEGDSMADTEDDSEFDSHNKGHGKGKDPGDDVSMSSSQREISVHSGTSLADDLPPLVLRRYFGKPGKESFFARYHWLAQQYRKLNLPGEKSEFVFENIDDPIEEYFFSRGDADIEEELGNVSTSMIEEFESIFDGGRRKGEKGGYDSEDTEVSQLDCSSPSVIKRKDSRQMSFDSWPNTPTGSTAGINNNSSGPPTPTGGKMVPSRLPSLQSFSEVTEGGGGNNQEEKTNGNNDATGDSSIEGDADAELMKSLSSSPWDSDKHRVTASRYSMHSKSRSNMGNKSNGNISGNTATHKYSHSRSMNSNGSRSNISMSRSVPSLPGTNQFRQKQLDSWGLSFSSSDDLNAELKLESQASKLSNRSSSNMFPSTIGNKSMSIDTGHGCDSDKSNNNDGGGSRDKLVALPPTHSVGANTTDMLPPVGGLSGGASSSSLQRVLEPQSPGPEKGDILTKLPSLTSKRSNILNLHTPGASFHMGTSSSLKKQIADEEFFTSEFIGDCNGLQAPDSPRSRYIMSCLAKGLTPKASLIVRKMLTRNLDLQHLGIGDEMAEVLAASLRSMPCLESINLEDNNLSDDGMGPILQALSQVESLRNLNLASNEIGGVAAEELGNYLVRSDCPLQVLTLHHADVDDFEGERFVNALASNTSLTEVDLSFNKIGSAENLNTVYPDLVTATEAMAELLAQPTCPLKKLKLTWNMMRLDSAVQFAQALAINESLTYLDVSYNAFGNDAGCAMGDALLDNKTIRTLLISNNGLDSKACFTICIGIQENLGLTKCNMDGNPIGEAGAKALMVLPSVVGTRVNVSANNCNTSIRDPTFWFDQNYPCAEYELHLNDPFERAVCYMLLGLVACHQTLIMTRVYFETMERGQKRSQKLDLIQETFTDKCKYLDDSQLAILQNLYALQAAANNTSEAVALFHKYDADESGALDKGELKLVLADFGMLVDDDKIDDFINTYDVDGEGLIEMPEFLSFVKSQHQEAAMRIRDMTENMGMALAATPESKFNPAREGVLRFEVIDSFIRKAKYQVISSSDGTNLTDVAKKTGDVAKLLSYGFQNSKIRLSEALDLYTTMLGEGGEKFKTVAKLLPQIESTDEARLFITRVTKNDRVEQSRVKIAMGNALKPIIGLPNGFYMLDLSRDMDRICLSRLLEISNTGRFRNMAASKLGHGIVGDTSQYGNWSSFRNEMFSDERVEITTKMFTPMPRSGKLHFDFCSTERVPEDAVLLSDAKFLKIMANLCLVETPDDIPALARLAVMKKEAKKTLGGTGVTVYEATIDHALQTALDITQFYEELINRDVMYNAAMKAEEVKVSLNKSGSSSPWGSRPASKASSRPASKNAGRLISGGMSAAISGDPGGLTRAVSVPFFPPQDASLGYDPFFNTSHLPTEQGNAMSAMGNTAAGPDVLTTALSMPMIDTSCTPPTTATGNRDMMKTALKELLDSGDVAPEAKGFRLVEAIEEMLGAQYIRARHLALIMEKFPEECCVDKVPMFSTYRVDVVVSLFPRVKDLYNFELVLRILKPHEIAYVYARLGRLNLFNPSKPEGALELNMSLYEERQIAKILVVLSVIEPGDNFIGAKFRWDRESPFIPGWDVTQPWTTEDGLSKKGFFSVQYYAGQGKGKAGCKADILWRRCLMQMTAVKESDIIDEDDEQNIPKSERPKIGEEHMLGKGKERWLSYLTPNAEELRKLHAEIRRAQEEEDRKNGVVKRFRPSKKKK